MSRQILRFADCSLDVAARVLTRGGERMDLPSIVFDCMAYLVTHRDRAVGRDELVSAVWGKSAASDTTLSKAILSARRAIGDNAEAQTLIRTVPRFGYHWVGDVREDTDDAQPSMPAVPAAGPSGWTRSWKGPLTAAALLLVVVAVAVAWSLGHGLADRRLPAVAAGAAGSPPEVTAGMTAVLPVEVLAGPADAWLRLGLMDLIAHRLRDAGVPVMSSDSVVGLLRRYDGDAHQLSDVLQHANADLRLVKTSVAQRGGEWLVHVTMAGHSIDASAADPVVAARMAADRLLDALDLRPAYSPPLDLQQKTLEDLLQRTEAARLADDLDTARRLLGNAPAELRNMPEVRLRGAQIEARDGHFDEAARQLAELLAVLPAETKPQLRARVLASLCSIENQLDHADEAIARCTEAIDLGSAHGATEAVAIAFNNRAISHSRRRDFGAAEADFARARVLLRREGDMLALARVAGNEATMLMGRGRPAEALPIFQDVGRHFDAFGLANETLIAIVNEVDADLELLHATGALAASDRGWVMLPRVREATIKHQMQRLRAEALAANGRLGEAHAVLDGLLGAVDPEQEGETLALARASLAALELDGGHPESASVLAGQALASLPAPEDLLRRARAARIEVLALARLGRAAAASEALERFQQWTAAADTRAAAFYAELTAAEIEPAPTTADDLCERAAATAADLQLPALVAHAAVSCGSRLIARGELERAAIVVGRVARYAETDYASSLLEAQLYCALGQQAPWQAALVRARALAGERRLPPEVTHFATPAAAVAPLGKHDGSGAEP